jgi:hypothetical protein
MRTRIVLVIAMIAGALMVPAATATAQTAPTCGPYVTLTPSFGEAGTEVSVNLFNFLPNDDVTVILRVPGNPVVATGTTDAEGRANIVFTMLEFPGDRVAIFVTATPCYAAGAYFELREVTPTPTFAPTETPTPTATVTTTPPTTTVTTTPTTPATAATKTATPRPVSPQAPVAGTGGDGGFGGSGANLALVGLALVIFCGAFALWGTTRHLRTVEARTDSRGRSRIWIDRDGQERDDE